jgi:predicted acylesterase/phospholipase RssA
MILRAFPILALVLLSACATDKPLAYGGCHSLDQFRIPVGSTPADNSQVGAAQVGTAETGSALEQAFAETLPMTAGAGSPEPSQFLILSGGGQWGAFGAGFLKGWSDKGSGDAARPPRFNVVTGISTGGLQATFAFLGRDYDQKLLDAYTITNERQLLLRHGSTFFLSHASMADIGPADSYIRARLRPLIDQVAAPENQGRKLLVGTVDAFDGNLYAIDLTRIARELSGPEREDCYVGALLASAAVPVVFRQVTVGGRPYFDGGVRKSVFITAVQDAAGKALAGQQQPGTMWVLINGDPVAKKIDALPAKLLPSLNRLRTIVFNQVELTSIYETAHTFPGMTTRVAAAAGTTCEAMADEDNEIFSPKTMACLRDDGEKRWKSGVPWVAYPSR